jgi:hypothetical protein
VTIPRRPRHQASPAPAADPQAGEKDLAELSDPYDLLGPGDQWAQSRPAYVVVVDQLRDWEPGRRSPSLAELLETRPSHIRQPEPDLEAEP